MPLAFNTLCKNELHRANVDMSMDIQSDNISLRRSSCIFSFGENTFLSDGGTSEENCFSMNAVTFQGDAFFLIYLISLI